MCCNQPRPSRVSVVTASGAIIAIDDASAADTIRNVKEVLYVVDRQLPVRRQRLTLSVGSGPHGAGGPLADDETLGGAGVAQDGSAEFDVLLTEVTADEKAKLNLEVISHVDFLHKSV